MFDPALTRPLALAEPALPPVGASPAQQGPHLVRLVARSSDRIAWLRARSRGITATDVAKLSTPKSVESAAYDKLNGTGFGGNVFTQYGRAREPEIASWVAATHGIQPSDALYHAEADRRHLATPDGLTVRAGGTIELAEIKTTNKAFRSIPRNYLRQIWWQQYVLGAERTLFVWEQHSGFVPVHEEPQCLWVDRDDAEISKLVSLAEDLITVLRRRTQAAAVSAPAASGY
ncbi:hypothetical protein GCM10009617_37950 [Leifsonia poae]|uniref:YqaJ viral recombinase domain-containing protein n=1 Tax=Leifsonia poae TaxID=110933 RepID=A0A9W6HA41_9MICO|nr:hypothetical protein GCM10017584_22730 [Leifsonia poae]